MKSIWGKFACAVAAAAWAVSVWAANGSTVYGKTLVRSEELPTAVLDKFIAFNAKPKKPGVLADTEDWRGDVVNAPSKGNPYRVVVTLVGTAEHSGDVTSRVETGWTLDGTTRMNIGGSVRKEGVPAGQKVEIVTASAPLSFKEDRQVLPYVGFAGTSNLKLEGVRVEVWSGIGKATPLQLLVSWSPLLTGVVFLGLFLWWRRR